MNIASEADRIRAVICCLSNYDEFRAKPVHINAIGPLVKDAFPQSDVVNVCEILVELKEFCKLPNGYYYPAPLRRVEWQEHTLVIGPNPTWQLATSTSLQLQNFGIGRTIRNSSGADLPAEDLNAWMGRSDDLKKWASAIVRDSEIKQIPTILGHSSIEVYDPTQKGRWVSLNGSSAFADQLYLCRRYVSAYEKTAFIGRVSGRKLISESSVDWQLVDRFRLQCAIALNAGVSSYYRCHFRPESVTLSFDYYLPSAEQRLLLALGRPEGHFTYKPKFEIPKQFFEGVENELSKIGLRRGVST